MNFDIEDKEDREERRQNENRQKISLILVFFFVLVTLILLITFLIMRNNNKNKTKTPVQAPTPITSPTPVKPMEQKKLTVFNEDSSERPIAVMIDNAIGDAKHAGLQESYLNYEILVEGGLTRIMAIYKDTDVPLIGPVRSSRHYFLDYVLENDAIYVHYGWSPYAEEEEKNLNINNINGLYDQSVFRRDSNSVAPHNVFTKMVYIKNFLEQTNYNDHSDDWQLLNYSVDELDLTKDTGYVAKDATKVIIPYSANEIRSYNYDSTNQYYVRLNNDKAQMDRRTNRQLHYKNIIIQRVDYEVIDNEGRLDVKTLGSGKGYVITDGHFLPIQWSKPSKESKTAYTYEDGSDVVLNDGNTFIQIVPVNTNITIE